MTMAVRAELVPQSAAWHAQRAAGIGASEVPAIAGVSGFATPVDVWMSKTGLADPSPDTPLARWGRLLEPVIAEEAERHLGLRFRRRAAAVHYRDWPVLFAHLDRTSADAILEVKTSMATRGWGESGSADVPHHVALQVQAQLACANKETGYVAALIGYRDFRTYRLERDREMFGELILPLLREFWTLVETATPPEPDGSDAYGSFLRRVYAHDSGGERVATAEEQLLGNALVVARTNREQAQAREKELIQRLQTAMGDASRLVGPNWRATWRLTKERVHTDWSLVAGSYAKAIEQLRAVIGLAAKTAADDAAVGDLAVTVGGVEWAALQVVADDLDLDAIRSLYTETKPGTRPFHFDWEEAD